MTTAARPPVALTARGLGFSQHGTEILRGVDLTVRAGERVALTGPSGSGKTTLLSVLAGLAAPTTGTVLFDGRPLDQHGGDLRRRIGVVFQGYALIALLTAAENIELGLMATGMPAAHAAERARQTLRTVGLVDRAEHLVEELSGGQQQRVAIARALAGRPEILLADEPSAEQDHAHRTAILDAILGAADTGTAVLLATHDADVALRCHRRIHLVDGRLTHPEALA